MTHGNEEAGALQVEVGIHVHKRIAANLLFALFILLNGKLSNLWQIVGCVILREIRSATT